MIYLHNSMIPGLSSSPNTSSPAYWMAPCFRACSKPSSCCLPLLPLLLFLFQFSHVRLFVTPWTAAHQASLSITNSRSPPKPMSIVSVGSWWWTGRPGMLRFIGSQRVRHDWATELTDWLTVQILALSPGVAWPWANYLTALWLCFFICQIG